MHCFPLPLLAVLAFSLESASAIGCTVAGYTQTDPSSACYRVYGQDRTFDQAEYACAHDGGHLVSIHRDVETNALRSLVSRGEILFIGLKCPSGIQDCTWSDGSSYDYRNFERQETREECTILNGTDMKWNGFNCKAAAPAIICSLPSIPPPCPAGYVARLGHCLKVVTTPKNFYDAEAQCASEGGHLTSIHSLEDAEIMHDIWAGAKIKDEPLLGVTFTPIKEGPHGLQGLWNWTDSSRMDYIAYFGPSESPTAETCITEVMRDNDPVYPYLSWRDVSCDAKRPFICQLRGDDAI